MTNNLISRQAAIDALAEAMPSLTTPDGCGQFDHDIQVTDEAYVDCMQIIHELPSAQPGWIPCSRELPKPNEEDGNGFHKAYLVQDGRWMDVARWDGKYWIAWGYSTVLLNVVAWMPLPKPYREGGQDGKN